MLQAKNKRVRSGGFRFYIVYRAMLSPNSYLTAKPSFRRDVGKISKSGGPWLYHKSFSHSGAEFKMWSGSVLETISSSGGKL